MALRWPVGSSGASKSQASGRARSASWSRKSSHGPSQAKCSSSLLGATGGTTAGGVRRGVGLRGAELAGGGRLAGGRRGEAHGRGRGGLVPVRAMPHGHEALRHAAGDDVREVQKIVQGGQERLELRVPELFLAHAGVHECFRDGCHGDGLVERELGGERAVNALACRKRDGRGHGRSFRRIPPLYGRMTARGGVGARMGRDAPCPHAPKRDAPCPHAPMPRSGMRRAPMPHTCHTLGFRAQNSPIVTFGTEVCA